MAGIEKIEVCDVSRRFGSTLALRRVSTHFERGAVTFIEGPNGAGKSTLLAVIGTALKPTAGFVNYLPYGPDPASARPHLGWVAHESRAYRELSGKSNVEFAARLYGDDDGDAWARVCSRVGAESFADQPVGTLSRGQRQRIALARALVHRPSALLLDEPLTGLDAASTERVESILREEAAAGAIVIVVSHSEALVERVGGRRIEIVGGRIVRDRAAGSGT